MPYDRSFRQYATVTESAYPHGEVGIFAVEEIAVVPEFPSARFVREFSNDVPPDREGTSRRDGDVEYVRRVFRAEF